jgi:hypothetical protein
MSCSENKNPLQRGGTNQQQRLLAATKSGYINIDERDYADWIVFASQFAAYLNYYDATNNVNGNWKPFFENDISAAIGTVAIQDINQYRIALSERFAVIKGDEAFSTVTQKKEALGSLFGCILTLCKALDVALVKLPETVSLKATIQNLIRIKLQPSLQKLLAYYKGGKAMSLVKEVDNADWKVLDLPVLKASTLITEGLSPIWIKSALNWEDFFNSIPEDRSIYGDVTWNNHRKINHAANHNLFSGLFDQFLLSYSKIISDAGNSLQQTLSAWNEHLPHYALFLAFLKLFRTSRDHANTLTQRHLDFYYKEVLQLFPKKAEPNKAHIVLELAKPVDNYLITKGTLFKAGKDSAGKEVSYAIDRDVVFNKAKVARLMAVYKGNAADNFGAVNNAGRLFAAPVINSADGLGAPPETEWKEWHPYINKKYTDGAVSAVTMPKATIGFAVASHYLYLTEGDRLMNIKFATAFTAAQHTALLKAEVYLTSEKGWTKVSNFSWGSGVISGTTTAASVLSFSLAGDVPAITNYDIKVHEGTFNTNLPVLKLVLKNEDVVPYVYESLKSIVISKVEVEVKVGLNAADAVINGGIKNLTLSNDTGVLDAAKPFLPFGTAPKKGASLVIGSEEVFKKKGAKVYFRVEWKDLPGSAYYIDYNQGDFTGAYYASNYVDANPKVNALALQKGVWQTVSGGTDVPILSDYVVEPPYTTVNPYLDTITFPDSLLALPDAAILDYTQPWKPFDITAIKGFLKLTLKDGFGHDEYQKAYTAYLIALANGGTPALPVEPYTPSIQKISLHYKASSVLDVATASTFDGRAIQFFHVYPFGEVEQHKKLNNSDIKVLPQFVNPANTTANNEGEFYIGFENLLGGQSVNVLFQVLEGTTNPLLEKPDDHISWSYLSKNKWKAFTKQQVSDNTGQLVRSGIVSFVLPADAGIDNTVLPAGYMWIKASVTEKAETVCKLMAVLAQAAVVTFQDNNNAADFMDKALPAGTISKLKETTSSIKKIEQPYASFGGRANEANGPYYVRVSERLRHKARAITIWDYEHLVLEAFPGIHKVKCLNHTKYEGNDYNEVAPGHVTIITIPDLVNRNDANPLRPYTNQDVLSAVNDFLRERLSCHVKLHVRHPQFEEVRLDFKLKLINGLEFNFYHDLLQQEITAYLTPWAYGKTTDVEFGGKVHKSVLIDFIEERSYVDYITDVKMYHRVDETVATESADTDLIEASTAKSILVSAPAKKHAIAEIIELPSATLAEDCIDEYNSAD